MSSRRVARRLDADQSDLCRFGGRGDRVVEGVLAITSIPPFRSAVRQYLGRHAGVAARRVTLWWSSSDPGDEFIEFGREGYVAFRG